MVKVKSYKNFIIATENEIYHIFTKEEYLMGNGYRYPEFEVCSIQEAIDFINSY